MQRINVILLILLLNSTFVLMLKKKRIVSLKETEYYLDTCCSFDETQQLTLSCLPNEQIQLKLIEIYYNSNEYCSSEFSCCKYRTQCSRRITKYSTLNCDGKSSCSISKTCLKIYDSCSSIEGLYGQYITIQYSCLTNETEIEEEEQQPVPFIVKLSTTDERNDHSVMNDQSFLRNLFMKNDLKSSPLFLIMIIFLFLLFLIFTYWLADQLGRKYCRKNSSKTKNTISTEILLQHPVDEKIQVQTNPTLTINRIYPTYSKSSYQNISPYSYHQRYLTVHHHPFTQQHYSRTFYPYFNY